MKLFFILSFFLFISFATLSKEIWKLDKNLSTINFELPVLLAKNIKGTFKEIEGIIQIDLSNQKKNKAFFSIDINSVEMNYKKYKDLFLGNIFFNSKRFPKVSVNTKKFSYKNEELINLNVELTIKGITNPIPLTLEIISLAEELMQIRGNFTILRTAYKIGTDPWDKTSILKDKVRIDINLFLFKE